MPLDESNRNELNRLYLEGNRALQSGSFPLAVELFEKCLALDPSHAYALNNIGLAAESVAQLDRAIGFYRRAIVADRNVAAFHGNLGRANLQMGDFAQAEASFLLARELAPESIAWTREMGRVFRAKRDFSAAADAFLKVIASNPESLDGMACAITMSVIHYLNGDQVGAQNMIQKARPLAEMPGPQYLGARRYIIHISQLLALGRAIHSQIFPTLNVIGDSHSVSAHGVNIEIDGANFTCESAWIEGCRQWDVGCESSNQHKATFDICLRATPKRNPVLVLFGQLDCLAEGGIFRQWQKDPASEIEQLISSTIRNYMAVISKSHEEGWRGIMIGGVPAPSAQYPIPEGPHGAVYIGMVRSFNALLRQSVHDAGLPFLDLYAMTETPAGLSNGHWNLDNIHLRPDALAEAFRKHLLR